LLLVASHRISPLRIVTQASKDNFFDVATVATARLKDLPLITKDEKIFRSALVDVAW
jgi:hypothetical protein